MNSFKITTFNIDCAKRDENYENTKFDNRFEGIIDIIKTANPDILFLQELRSLNTSKIKVHDIVSRICAMGINS